MIERLAWGRTGAGQEVGVWALRSGNHELHLAEQGARWLSWLISGRNLLIGPDSVAAIERDSCYVGAVVGRYANRLAGGRFSIDGREYQVPPNRGPNALHGGAGGLSSLVWQGEAAMVDGCPAVRFTCVSPDGDQGFPGTLSVEACYVLGDGWVRLDYTASADATTVINLTNHAYFNFAQPADVRGHQVQVAADQVVAVDDQALPTGGFWPVADTDFDLRSPQLVGQACDSTDPRITVSRGIDHCYVLDPATEVAARLSYGDLTLEVLTDQPGLQVYCGQWLTGDWRPFQGLCLETQHFPDSPNHPQFPSTLLDAGERWTSSTSWRLA